MSLSPRYSLILERIDRSTSFGDNQYLAAFHAAGVSEKVAAQITEIRANPKLSAEGHRAEISKALAALLPTFAEVTGPIHRAMAQVVGRTAEMTRIKVDKTDLVGELRRREMRDEVKALPVGERLKYLVDNIDVADLAEAVLTAPVPKSLGLSQEQLKLFAERYCEARFGHQVKEIASQRDTIEKAMVIAKVARNDMISATGMAPSEFDRITAPIEAA